jgi:hypothetical protein
LNKLFYYCKEYTNLHVQEPAGFSTYRKLKPGSARIRIRKFFVAHVTGTCRFPTDQPAGYLQVTWICCSALAYVLQWYSDILIWISFITQQNNIMKIARSDLEVKVRDTQKGKGSRSRVTENESSMEHMNKNTQKQIRGAEKCTCTWGDDRAAMSLSLSSFNNASLCVTIILIERYSTLECPFKTPSNLPVATFHIRTVSQRRHNCHRLRRPQITLNSNAPREPL